MSIARTLSCTSTAPIRVVGRKRRPLAGPKVASTPSSPRSSTRRVERSACAWPRASATICAIEPLLPCLRRRRAVADKGFGYDTLRRRLRRQRTRICIPIRRGRRAVTSSHRGYYRRHRAENFFGRSKRFRRISTRYEKLAATFLALVQFAAVFDWLTFRFYEHGLGLRPEGSVAVLPN